MFKRTPEKVVVGFPKLTKMAIVDSGLHIYIQLFTGHSPVFCGFSNVFVRNFGFCHLITWARTTSDIAVFFASRKLILSQMLQTFFWGQYFVSARGLDENGKCEMLGPTPYIGTWASTWNRVIDWGDGSGSISARVINVSTGHFFLVVQVWIVI